MIQVTGLSKYYSNNRAIEKLNFEVGQGDIVGLLGLNGAGKSTILKILGCYLAPSAGEAVINGISIHESPQEVRKLIGYLPDTPPLYDEMTVINWLDFAARLKNVGGSVVSRYVDDAISKTGLSGVANDRLGSLSHGYRQRAGIAQAIVHQPKVLILDEPINGLDPVQIVEMRDLILSLKGNHTVILSSHILSEITRTCDRILVIDKGSLVAEGSEAELEKSISGQGEINLQWEGDFDKVVAGIEGLPGVRGVEKKNSSRWHEIAIKIQSDENVDIANVVVSNGAFLRSMTGSENGLESLFMKLVN